MVRYNSIIAKIHRLWLVLVVGDRLAFLVGWIIICSYVAIYKIIVYMHYIASSYYVTEFAKRGLIHSSEFTTSKSHNFILE